MEHAGSFTAVSGSGLALVGGIGLAAGAVASQSTTEGQWLSVWVAAALGAAVVAVFGIWRKSSRLGLSLISGPARRFALSLIPPLLAGAILTVVFYRTGLVDQLPGMWLLVYGAGVVAGGTLSIRIVPVMGVCFMTLGVLAFVTPAHWGNGFMVGGFGIMHIVFGVIIAVRHGG